MPNSYAVAVKTKLNRLQWATNGLRFNFFEDAQRYAKEIKKRWPDVIETSVQHSDDKANTNYPVPSDRYPVDRTS